MAANEDVMTAAEATVAIAAPANTVAIVFLR